MAEDNPKPIPEMVERLAQSGYERRQRRMKESGAVMGRECPWDELPETIKNEMRSDARSDIEAMREPTIAMRDAGMNMLLPQTKPHAPELEPMYRDAAQLSWAAMIDAALGR